MTASFIVSVTKITVCSCVQCHTNTDKMAHTTFYVTSKISLFDLSTFLIPFISSLILQVHYMCLLVASPYLQVSSFSFPKLFSFFPLYFYESIFDALHNLTILKRLQLGNNKMNLKNEVWLKVISCILFFPNYKLLF
jgi:hypothetical protein